MMSLYITYLLIEFTQNVLYCDMYHYIYEMPYIKI